MDARSERWFSRSFICTLYMWKTFDDSSDGDSNGVSGSSSMGHCSHVRNCLTYSHHKIRRTLIYAYAYIAFRVAVSLCVSSSEIRSGQFCNTFAAKVATESVPAMLVGPALTFCSPFTYIHLHSLTFAERSSTAYQAVEPSLGLYQLSHTCLRIQRHNNQRDNLAGQHLNSRIR